MVTASTHASPATAAITTGRAAIEVSGVSVRYGAKEILRDISLRVPVGSVYGLVGPSGSGKTTLMRTILGLSGFAGGRVTVLDRPAGTAELRRLVGYMPQNAAIYPDLSGRENLEFFGAVYGVGKDRIATVLDLIDLTPIADRTVASYSGGERQRVALAAALVPDPPLLILDEPTIGLDPHLRHRIWSQFRAWAAEGRTLLVSTHVMDEAGHVDRLAFLLGGQVIAEGTPDDFLSRTGTTDLESAVLHLSERDRVAGRL